MATMAEIIKIKWLSSYEADPNRLTGIIVGHGHPLEVLWHQRRRLCFQEESVGPSRLVWNRRRLIIIIIENLGAKYEEATITTPPPPTIQHLQSHEADPNRRASSPPEPERHPTDWAKTPVRTTSCRSVPRPRHLDSYPRYPSVLPSS